MGENAGGATPAPLERLDGLPVHEHAAVFEEALAVLETRLASVDESGDR